MSIFTSSNKSHSISPFTREVTNNVKLKITPKYRIMFIIFALIIVKRLVFDYDFHLNIWLLYNNSIQPLWMWVERMARRLSFFVSRKFWKLISRANILACVLHEFNGPITKYNLQNAPSKDYGIFRAEVIPFIECFTFKSK